MRFPSLHFMIKPTMGRVSLHRRYCTLAANEDQRNFLFRLEMDELDETQLKNEVDSLKLQLQITREKTSVTIPELVKWIEEKMAEDPFLNAEIMRDNPWVESGKCVLL